jgi:DNA-binding response OmpR family regulator
MSTEAPPSTSLRPLLLAAVSASDDRLQILEGLPEFGWRVMTASNGNEIPALVAQHGPDALLVDAEMADRASGSIRLLPMLRVALVAPGDSETALTLLRAMRINACLHLPLQIELLAASLDGLLRLSKPSIVDESNLNTPRAGEDMGVWLLSVTTWTLTAPNAAPLQLTQSETRFLAKLAENPGAPVPRPQMIAALGHNIDYYDSRRLDTLVSRLRLKVNRDSCQCLPVRSIHSVGYAFVAQIVLDD